jgi:hypothetical protein
MSTQLTLQERSPRFDPSTLGWPPMLPVELAMHIDTAPAICEAYGIDRERFIELTNDPLFVAAYNTAKDELRKDGMSFRIKAKLQAEALLAKSWAIIHATDTPTTVKADLIKATVRWAGYEPKPDGALAGGGSAFQININLG